MDYKIITKSSVSQHAVVQGDLKTHAKSIGCIVTQKRLWPYRMNFHEKPWNPSSARRQGAARAQLDRRHDGPLWGLFPRLDEAIAEGLDTALRESLAASLRPESGQAPEIHAFPQVRALAAR